MTLLAVAAGCDTPTVYQIAGEGDPGLSYNVLFLSDGFESDEQLNVYRRAAHDLAQGILASDPFCQYPKSINFYRADLRSGPIDTASCSDGTGAVCAHAETGTLPESEVPPPVATFGSFWSVDVLEKDLGTALCWTETAGGTGTCRFLWTGTTGQADAFDLALGIWDPAIDAVVIVSNTAAPLGGGAPAGTTESLGLAVVGIPVDDASRVTDKAGQLFAHELAHVLGLLDEYADATGIDVVDAESWFPPDRNVWRPVDLCWAPPAAPDPPIPWAALLTCGSFIESASCEEGDPLPACADVWVPVHPLGSDCVLDSSTEAPEWCVPCRLTRGCMCPSSISAPCFGAVGLWEGGFYQPTGHYRSQYTCRMDRLAEPFCRACERHLTIKLAAHGPRGVCP